MPNIDRDDENATRYEPVVMKLDYDNLLAAYHRMKAERDRSISRMVEMAEPGFIGAFARRDAEIERRETAERQLAVTQAAIAATSKVIAEGAAKESQWERQLAELQQDAEIGRKWRENSSLEEWFPFTAQQLAELQRKHDGLVAKFREPSNETLSAMMDAWENTLGTPYTRYAAMLNVAVDAAMSAVALREGEK